MSRLFAGPLSRAFAPGGGSADELRAGVLAWRRDLQSALADRLDVELSWDEGARDVLQLELGEQGMQALRLWALYAERPELDFPDTVPSPLELDRTWRTAADARFPGSRYGQVLAPKLWLPVELAFTVRFPLPDGQDAEIGSLPVLADQLRWLNERTFQGGPEAMTAWEALAAEPGSALVDAARRGLSLCRRGAGWAMARRLPLLVG